MAGASADNEDIRELNEDLEIVSLSGTLQENGRTHFHMVVSNVEGQTFAGHVKLGCITGVTAKIIIAQADDATFEKVVATKNS